MDHGFECWRGNSINSNSREIDMDECKGTPLTNIGGGQNNNHCTGFPKGTYTQEYQGMTFAIGGWHREPVYERHQVWVGCYVDDGDRMFARGPHQYGYNGNTCASQCSQIGTTHFSLQNGGWCACGTQDDFDKKTVYTHRPDAECGQTEDRFAGYRGGGGWRNAVYKISQAPELHVNQETTEVPVGFGYFTGSWMGHCSSAFTAPNWQENLGSIPADCNVQHMARAPDGKFIATNNHGGYFKMVKVDGSTGETVP